MRRTTPVWLLAIVLAVATGAVLSGTVAVVTAPISSPMSVDRSSAVVWAFYDAANYVLQTGETASLDALLADDMVEHDPPPGLPPSGSSLIRRLLGLHATHLGMTLVVEEVLASGDFATARVHVEEGEPGVFLGLPIGEDRAPWGPLDQFWVVDGRIVAHWGSAAPSTLLEPLQQASGATWFPPGEFVAVERLTVPVRSQPAPLNAAGVRIIYLEVGSLTVAIDSRSAGPGLLSAAAGAAPAGPPELLAPGEQGTLGPGELLALPMAPRHAIVNTASVAVEAVVVTSRSAYRPSDETSWQDFGLLPGLDPERCARRRSYVADCRTRLRHPCAGRGVAGVGGQWSGGRRRRIGHARPPRYRRNRVAAPRRVRADHGGDRQQPRRRG